MNIVSQCCAFVVLFILFCFRIRVKRLPMRADAAFTEVWIILMVSVVLDILSVVAICNDDIFPDYMVKAVCILYLASIVWDALAVFKYVGIEILLKDKRLRRLEALMIIYGILSFCLIMSHSLEIVHNTYGYVYTTGPAVMFTNLVTAFVLFLTLFMICLNRHRIDSKRKNAVIIWVLIWFAAGFLHFMFEKLLIVSFANSIGLLIMYLIVENPEMSIDRETGVFNISAFQRFMHELEKMKKNVSILCIEYDMKKSGSVTYDIEKQVTREIINFFCSLENGYVFVSPTEELYMVFDDEKYAQTAISKINNRFENAWGEWKLKIVAEKWRLLRSTAALNSQEDVLPLFQYIKQHQNDFAISDFYTIDDKLIEKMYEEIEMEKAIVDALSDNRVEVFFQPIYSVKDKKFNSAEALVRIRDVDGSIIPPGKFIGVAEKQGYIIHLGERVFDQVCQFIQEEDIESYGLDYIEVNLSVVQCAYDNLANDFIAILNHYHIDPKKIILEITESASVSAKQTLLENMNKLRAVGLRFALDDFGTGQSNLNYIVEMPVDVVKFDSTMVNAYFEDDTAKYVMDAAMHMIQGMDLEIVSEGIEKKEQYHTMEGLGIDYIQGYYFSKPVSRADFLEFLAKNRSFG